MKSIWVIEKVAESKEPLILIPDGFPELFLNLNKGFEIWCRNGEMHELSTVSALGQLSQVAELKGQLGSKGIFVKFYPWAYNFLVSAPMNDIVDASSLLKDVSDIRDINDVYTRFVDSESQDEQIELIERFLLDNLSLSEDHTLSFVDLTLKKMIGSRGSWSMDHYFAGVRCSRRYIEKQFKQRLGLPPSKYRSVLRMKEVSRRISENQYETLGQLSLEAGFHDASHFTNQFLKYVGMTPKAFKDYMSRFPLINKKAYLQQFEHDELLLVNA